MIVALGIGCDGRKTVLGIRERATENATVVSALLSELVERGLDFSTPRLYMLDGGKALPASWVTCRVNTKPTRGNSRTPMRWAEYADAKGAPEKLHHQFRKVIGNRQIPLLLSSMANTVSKKPITKGAASRVAYECRESRTFNDVPGNLIKLVQKSPVSQVFNGTLHYCPGDEF